MDDLSIHTHKKMEIIFPIVGHSFLPADRVFGRTAKEFRKRDTILEPCDYINNINENATLKSEKNVLSKIGKKLSRTL